MKALEKVVNFEHYSITLRKIDLNFYFWFSIVHFLAGEDVGFLLFSRLKVYSKSLGEANLE